MGKGAVAGTSVVVCAAAAAAVGVAVAAPAGGGVRQKAEGGDGDRGGGAEVRDAHGAAARHCGRHGGGDGARAARRPPRTAQDAHQLRRHPPHRVRKCSVLCMGVSRESCLFLRTVCAFRRAKELVGKICGLRLGYSFRFRFGGNVRLF
jgi:hypothetical protein